FSRTIVHASFVVLVMLMFMYVLHFRHLSAKADDFASAEAVDTPPSTPSYMESEDHYLKCVNDGGVEVVRASLTEFAGKFGNLGFRCHKSFWVAQHAVDHKRRDGRRLLLVLKDGTEIPVGRSYEKSVLSRLSVAGIFGARKAYGSAE
ncbi:MAG: LytTR family DNA-binding domain-containing protein, partial [Pseudomonadota bacterium]